MKKYTYLVGMVILVLLGGACKKSHNSGKETFLHSKWILQTVEGIEDLTVRESKSYISFNSGGNTTTGTLFSGCNTSSLKAELPGESKIIIKEIIGTKIACLKYEKLEEKLFQLLPNVTFYEIKGKNLFLKNKDNVVVMRASAE